MAQQWFAQTRPKDADPGRWSLKEQDLMEYAGRQVRIEGFVDIRFRPGLQVTAEDVGEYYEKVFLPELKRRGIAETPPLEAVRSRLEQVLIEERVSRLLDDWLADLRSRTRVTIMEVEKP